MSDEPPPPPPPGTDPGPTEPPAPPPQDATIPPRPPEHHHVVHEPATLTELEETLDEEPADRFRTYVALGIAVISILGAVVAFRASLSEQEAHRNDLAAVQTTARVEQIRTQKEAIANDDLRNAAIYQQHIKAAAILDKNAAAVATSDPPLSASLAAQADQERVLARTTSRFFQGTFPEPGDALGPVVIDRDAEIDRLLANDDQYSELHPEQLYARADQVHSRAVYLLGIVTLFIAALLFLTLAQFTRPHVRRLFAAAGVAVSLAGVILWVVVERAA